MTLKEYFSDTATEGSAAVLEIGRDEPTGRLFIILNKTLFHARGGGQLEDTGYIGKARVVDVRHADNQTVRHFVEDTQGLNIGDIVSQKIDGERRLLHSRLHTAGHLLAAVTERIAPGLRGAAGHHWPNEARVEFSGQFTGNAGVLQQQIVEELEALIRHGLPVNTTNHPFEPRRIQIGEFPAIPCGGTHVENVQVVKEVVIRNIKSKGGKTRIGYDIAPT